MVDILHVTSHKSDSSLAQKSDQQGGVVLANFLTDVSGVNKSNTFKIAGRGGK